MPSRSKQNQRIRKSGKNNEKRHTSLQKEGSFRVIGGEWRSRRLSFPAIEGLRPTTDRVKETVFNWLMPSIEGARVLDLFAGSGSLGFEALSRGADHLTAIEKNREAARSLTNNLELLGVRSDEMVDVINQDAIAWLEHGFKESTGKTYDIVFLDPPFRKNFLNECLLLLINQGLLKPGALVYIEKELEDIETMVPLTWHCLKEKVAGQVCYQLYKTGPN